MQEAVGLADGLFDGVLDELRLGLVDELLLALAELELDDGDELGVELLDEQPAMPTAAMMATGTSATAFTLNSNLLHLSIGDHMWSDMRGQNR